MGTVLNLERVEGYAHVGGREVAIVEENMTMGSIQASLFLTIDQRCNVLLLLQILGHEGNGGAGRFMCKGNLYVSSSRRRRADVQDTNYTVAMTILLSYYIHVRPTQILALVMELSSLT